MVSQQLSAQNNQYAKVVGFEVVCPDPLHLRLTCVVAWVTISFSQSNSLLQSWAPVFQLRNGQDSGLMF